MKSEKMLLFLFCVAILISGTCLSGCNMPLKKIETPMPEIVKPVPSIPPPAIAEPTAVPTNTLEPEIVHMDLPGSPPGKVNQTVHDQVDDRTASEKQAFGGDDFKNGKYERPFDQEMNYLPFADLVMAQLNREDPLWVYVIFSVNQPFTLTTDTSTHFLVELDVDLDGRGDYLVLTGVPRETQWSTESVLVLANPDNNVGGTDAVKSDAVLSEGRGYYEEIFNNGRGQDADLAWSRLSKVDNSIAILAFKNTLTGGEKGKFIWLPWTDVGMLDLSLFDLNDKFTLEQAGHPMKEDKANYPLKALWVWIIPAGWHPGLPLKGTCRGFARIMTRYHRVQKRPTNRMYRQLVRSSNILTSYH